MAPPELPAAMSESKPIQASNPERSFADARLGEDLLWRELRVTRFHQPVPALFLDRDGVIIEEKQYIHDPGEVVLLPGVAELIRAARAAGMAVVEITNQAGIAHGYFDWPDFVRAENRVREVLAELGAEMDAVFACPFHESSPGPYGSANHPWRKPNAGMLFEAAKLLNLDLPKSMLVGDKASDLQAARAAKLACGIQVLTGYGPAQQELSRALASDAFSVYFVERADDAVPLLHGQAVRPRDQSGELPATEMPGPPSWKL